MDLRIDDMTQFLPKHWAPSTNYEQELYVLIDLDPEDPEYEGVKSLFPRPLFAESKVTIQRIQHPIAYLRYLLQSEHIQFHKKLSREQKIYASIDENDINQFINFNCDLRYLNRQTGYIFDGVSAGGVGQNVVVIQKRTDTDLDTDKNQYPLYLVKF